MSNTGKVFKYFTDRPGVIVQMTEMVKDLQMTKTQVVTCIGYLRSKKNINIELVLKGNAYRYNPGPLRSDSTEDSVEPVIAKLTVPESFSPNRRIFEELAPAKNGDIIIRGTDGSIWRATEV